MEYPRDSLTGALMRSSMSEAFENSKTTSMFSLIFLDLDYLKMVNDTHGHQRGDAVLRHVGNIIRNSLRSTDSFFRYGGDEFLILCPATSSEQAVSLGTRMLEFIRTNPLETSPRISISCSVGVATWPNDGETFEEVLQRADKRQYVAKALGRNRLVATDERSGMNNRLEFSRILGRESEVVRANSFIQNLIQGKKGLLAVRGEPGIGKSRFCNEVVSLATVNGLTVLHLSTLSKGIPLPLTSILPCLEEHINIKSMNSEDIAHSLALASRGSSGILIVADPIENIDRASMIIVNQLLKNEALPNCGIMYATNGMAWPFPQKVNFLTEVITLKPLPAWAVEQWAACALGSDLDSSQIESLLTRTHGNPAAIQDMLYKMVDNQGGDVHPDGNSSNLKTLRPTIPLPPGPLIGREVELETLSYLLNHHRLITVTGSGGIGKTRLVMELASRLVTDCGKKVHYLQVEGLSSSDLLLPAVFRVMGISQIPGDTLEQTLSSYESLEEEILILDGLEHLPKGASQLGQLIRWLPRLKVIVISREALMNGGLIFPLYPLHTSGCSPIDASLDETGEIASLCKHPAVMLFIDRALMTDPYFELHDNNIKWIARLCKRLDCIPLAVELAASCVNLLTPRAIVEQLPYLGQLQTHKHDVFSQHQQSLWDAIDWSYKRLDTEEQGLFRALGVFKGWFSADDVVEALTKHLRQEAKFQHLQNIGALLNKSLLIKGPEIHGHTYYRMLENIREYALSMLNDKQEAQEVCMTHAEYYMTLSEELYTKFTGKDQAQWLDIADTKHDNFRSAMEWACAVGKKELALRIAHGLWRFWVIRGHIVEGIYWLSTLLQDADVPLTVKAKALFAAGALSIRHGNYTTGEQYLTESLSLLEFTDDSVTLGLALNALGVSAMECLDFFRAQGYFERALGVRRAENDLHGVAVTLNNLGNIAFHLDDLDVATELHTESLLIRDELKDLHGVAMTFHNLASVELQRGNLDKAERLHTKAKDHAEQLKDPFMRFMSLVNSTELSLCRGNYMVALELSEQCVSLAESTGLQMLMGDALDLLGWAALLDNDLPLALGSFSRSLRSGRAHVERRRLLDSMLGMHKALKGLGVKDSELEGVSKFLIIHNPKTPPCPRRRIVSEYRKLKCNFPGDRMEYIPTLSWEDATKLLERISASTVLLTD